MGFNFSKKVKVILGLLSLFIVIAAGQNFSKSLSSNNEKLPEGLEDEHKFLKWINRWKEEFPQIEADTFKKIDDGEIISSTNPRYTFEPYNEEVVKAEVAKYEDVRYHIVAPDKVQYVNYRAFFTETKEATSSYVYYYGKRDNKLLYGPIFECKKTKCWFDRGFFIEEYKLYVPQVVEKIYPEDPDRCAREGVCAYELYLHIFDLNANKRVSYVSSQLLTSFKDIQQTLEDY